MGKSIMVDPAKLTTAAGNIESKAGEYKKNYQQLYQEVEAMAAAWSDSSNTTFTTQIKGFQDDFENMYLLLLDYSEFLKTAANSYNATKDAIDSAARKLIN
ncbi:MAG: WXG100 family type VII secretion target [Clostridium sp.]|nr:WXG100 family type VII secretion target [Clostridium sp.]